MDHIENLEVKASSCFPGPNSIYYSVEYKGYPFALEVSGRANLFCFVPDIGLINDKETIMTDGFHRAYYDISNLYDFNQLYKLQLSIEDIGYFVYRNHKGVREHGRTLNNEQIHRHLENNMVTNGIKRDLLEACEWVYLLGNREEELYKIGMTTRRPDQRVKEFTPKLPFETEIIAGLPTGDAHNLERELHKKFVDKNTNGEWFRLTDGEVIYIRSMSV